MRRAILIPLLALGTVVGYGSAFHHSRCSWQDRQAAYEEHLAELCTNAAQKTFAQNAAAVTPAAPSAAAAPANVQVQAPAAPAPQSAPVQQISQAPAPVVIITGGGQGPVQYVTPAPPAPAVAPTPSAAPTANTPAPAK